MIDPWAVARDLPHSWKGDVRQPLFTFSLGSGDDVHLYGFYFTSIAQNIECAVVLGFTALVAIFMASLLYSCVISTKKHGTHIAYLLGYGVVMPFLIFSPMYFIQSFGITNTVFRFIMGTMPVLAFFRTLEAISGFCPPYATKSWRAFTLYYASPFLALYDSKSEKHVKATYRTLFNKLFLYIRGTVITGIIHSMYLQFPIFYAYLDFGIPTFDRSDWYSISALFRWQTLWGNLCFAVLFQTYLATCAFGLQFVTILVIGLELEEMWIDPLQKSSSFSDFWSKRWNLSVHRALKGGVFKPVRRHFPKYIALVATFLASGLFHEWLIWVVFSPLPESDCATSICYQPTYGPAIAFFLFQAALISLEFLIGNHLKVYMSLIPGPVATLSVLCIGGSCAHWFSDAYCHSSFFVDSRVAYLFVRRLD